MSQTHFKVLDLVADELGVKDTAELFQFALPVIVERMNKLEHFLGAGEWDAAAQCANTTISSVRLYGSDRLEVLLRQVQAAGSPESANTDWQTVRHDLSEEFRTAIDALQSWLDVHASRD